MDDRLIAIFALHVVRFTSVLSLLTILFEPYKWQILAKILYLKQGFGSVFIWSGSGSSILGWLPIRILGFDGRKFTAEKNLTFFDQTTIYLSLGLHKGRPSYRRSLQLAKENIQHFKTRNFLIFILLLWFTFALLNPYPDSEYGFGSTDLIESRIQYGSGSETLNFKTPVLRRKHLRAFVWAGKRTLWCLLTGRRGKREKGKDPDPEQDPDQDPYLWLTNGSRSPGGPKTCGSRSRQALTLFKTPVLQQKHLRALFGRETHAVMFAHGTERRLVSAQTSALVHRIHEIILAHLVRTEQHLASAGTTSVLPPFGRLAANIRIR